MRILFDSRNAKYKTPFGCVSVGETCTLHIYIPASVGSREVSCCLQTQDAKPFREVPMTLHDHEDAYEIWQCSFALEEPALLFWYFRIAGNTGTFRLFKQGSDTNIEAGDMWQLTCTPRDFTTPRWAQGAVIYQVFPDRFCKSGDCDLTGKLTPYTVHENWNEEVCWRPDEKGRVLNNDFYGGNFRGITEKLDYIASLGVNILYLNPISKSFSSHRYDTGDYKTPDPMLGTVEDFRTLCAEAHSRGIRVILDGVFSHTGSDSLYFNREGSFDGVGAYQSPDSPFYSWYTFHNYPNSYLCWWNFDTLPTVNKLDKAFMDYIIEGEDSVVAFWLRQGADGFRLDVADELPNAFMAALHRRVRQLKPDALVLGEVWEDASNKEAYGIRRRYFVDGTLDSVMNYPFRTAILKFLRQQAGAEALSTAVMTVLENYPRQVALCNMNLLGTHDTPRILTALMGDSDGTREQMAKHTLSPEDLETAKKRLLLASVIQYTLPGSPSLYYGDEALMQGCKDPFNRRTYPWGGEDETLLAHFRALGRLRRQYPALALGETEFFRAVGGQLGFARKLEGKTIQIYVNRTDKPWHVPTHKVLYSIGLENGGLAPMGACILEA